MPTLLHVHSAFSFLDGCAYPEALVERAAEAGYQALALTDHDNLCGAVRFVRAAREAGLRPILGAEVTIATAQDAPHSHLTLLAMSPHGYENLCRLITAGYAEGGRRTPVAPWHVVTEHSADLIALSGCSRRGEIPRLVRQGRLDDAIQAARRYREVFGSRFYVEVQRQMLPGAQLLTAGLLEICRALQIPPVASMDVHYLRREDMPTHDLLTCVRTLCKVDEPHPERPFNAEAYLPTLEEFRSRFQDLPEALAATDCIAGMCEDGVLDLTRPDMPTPAILEGTPREFLRRLTLQGARRRYGKITPRIQQRLEHELDIIGRLGCENYFLTVWDIVREARARGIRTSGRGSVVDSAVGHCLGISDIDPIGNNLLFERFLSPERSQMPDIDIDFPREARDEIVRWVQERYGAEHVCGVCMFSTFRARSALRELGKAMGLPPGEVGLLARRLRHTNADEIEEAMRTQPQAIHQPTAAKRYLRLFQMCARVAGLPRMISTHLAGVVITSRPILAYTPLQPTAKGVIPIAHCDKDDIELWGLKTDLLSLPILGAVDQAAADCPYESIPEEDPETMAMIRAGDTIGVFELQSPAQRSLHARLGTRTQKDIIDTIAIIRPGPMLGGMVQHYVNRRLGQEKVEYLHPSLEPVLQHTYGVMIFQEQVLEVAKLATHMTAGEADILRKAIGHARSKDVMDKLRADFIARALANGLDASAAGQIFRAVAGFATGYGFAEGHARAFASIAYKSAYLLRHHPAHYIAGVLNHQPMGCYPPSTLVSQARTRGVIILPLDINSSQWLATSTEETIRIGFRQVKGMPEDLGRRIATQAPYSGLRDFVCRCHPPVNVLEALILGGAFDAVRLNRRALLWQAEAAVRAAHRQQGADAAQMTIRGVDVWPDPPELPDFTDTERLSLEHSVLGLTTSCHLISLLRSRFDAQGLMTTQDLMWLPGGQHVRIGGLTLCPHTPPTQSGRTVLFACLEDEFGIVDLVIFEEVYRNHGGYLVFREPVIIVEGRLQKRGSGRCIVVDCVRVPPHTMSPDRAAEALPSLPEPRINASAR